MQNYCRGYEPGEEPYQCSHRLPAHNNLEAKIGHQDFEWNRLNSNAQQFVGHWCLNNRIFLLKKKTTTHNIFQAF